MGIERANRPEYERTADPKTAEDWELARNKTSSPIYQIIEQLRKLNISIEQFVEMLLEDWIEFARKNNIKEREAIIRDRITASIMTEQNLQTAEKASSMLIEPEIENMRLDELRKLAHDLPKLISSLKIETRVLHDDIKQTEQNISAADEEIKAVHQDVLTDIQNGIKADHIQVLMANGEVMPEDKMNAAMAKIAAQTPGAKVLQLLYKEDADFFGKDFDPLLRARGDLAFQQLKGLCEMCKDANGEASASEMLKHLRVNRTFGKKWHEAAKRNEDNLAVVISKLRDELPKLDQQKKQLVKSANEINKLEDSSLKINQLIKHKVQIQP